MRISEKFNDFRNQKNILLTIDWLTLNVDDVFKGLILDQDQIFEHGFFKLELIQNQRTAHFNKVFRLYLKGQFIATISCDSNSKHILVNRAHIKFENHLFYDGSIENVATSIIHNFNIFNTSISRLDIACDGVILHNFLNNFLYEKDNKSIRSSIGRNCKFDNITPVGFDTAILREHNFNAYYIGQMGSKALNKSRSSRFIRYYNKSKEILETGKKEYINDYFKNNNFDTSTDIYRFEIVFASDFLAKLENFNWLHIFDAKKLQQLFQNGNQGLFEFYKKVEKQPIKYSEKLVIFKDFATNVYQRISKVVTDKIRTIRVGVKRLVNEILIGAFAGEENIESADNIRITINNLLNKFNQKKWFINRYPYWLKDAKKTARLTGVNCPNYELEIFI